MKSSVLIALSIVLVSIACTSKSAGSQPLANRTDAAQTQTPANTPAPVQEKEPCTLTLAPAINGLHLGMTADEVLGLFPGSKDDPLIKSALSSPLDELKVASFSLTPAKYGAPQSFSEVTGITFSLFDGRVFKIYLSYGGPPSPTVDKFVETFVGGTDFPPPAQWQGYPGMENQMKMIQCTGFEVRASASGRGATQMKYVEIRDLAAEKKMKDLEDKLLKKSPR
jgi:hypothetical protein